MQIIKNAKFQVIHCTYSKVVDEKYRQICLFGCFIVAVNIPLFFHNYIHFRSQKRPVFYGSGSGSDQNVSAPAAPVPAPAPHPCCMDGFSKSEPALSGACSAGPDPYRPIGK